MRSINSFKPFQKERGEMACRSLNAKAREYYTGTDPLTVYEVESGEQKLYCVPELELENITFEEMQATFQELQEQMELQDLKERFDGEKFTEDNWDELDELDNSEYVKGSENCGNSGTYVGYTWYVYTLVDDSEINVYLKPVTE